MNADLDTPAPATPSIPEGNSTEGGADYRRTYQLDAPTARELWDVACLHDAGRRDRLNAFWLKAGQDLGFCWTTVDNGGWLNHEGLTLTSSPGSHNIGGYVFTAEDETAVEADYAAVDWAREYIATDEALVLIIGATEGPASPGLTQMLTAAFRAGMAEQTGRLEPLLTQGQADKAVADAARFAMGSWLAWPDGPRDGPVEVADDRLIHWLKGVPARQTDKGREGRALLTDAAALFREYEHHHRTKYPTYQGETSAAFEKLDGEKLERTAKAERNAKIAGRIEAFLGGEVTWRSNPAYVAADLASIRREGWRPEFDREALHAESMGVDIGGEKVRREARRQTALQDAAVREAIIELVADGIRTTGHPIREAMFNAMMHRPE